MNKLFNTNSIEKKTIENSKYNIIRQILVFQFRNDLSNSVLSMKYRFYM